MDKSKVIIVTIFLFIITSIALYSIHFYANYDNPGNKNNKIIKENK
jgi:hypothetical protein